MAPGSSALVGTAMHRRLSATGRVAEVPSSVLSTDGRVSHVVLSLHSLLEEKTASRVSAERVAVTQSLASSSCMPSGVAGVGTDRSAWPPRPGTSRLCALPYCEEGRERSTWVSRSGVRRTVCWFDDSSSVVSDAPAATAPIPANAVELMSAATAPRAPQDLLAIVSLPLPTPAVIDVSQFRSNGTQSKD